MSYLQTIVSDRCIEVPKVRFHCLCCYWSGVVITESERCPRLSPHAPHAISVEVRVEEISRVSRRSRRSESSRVPSMHRALCPPWKPRRKTEPRPHSLGRMCDVAAQWD